MSEKLDLREMPSLDVVHRLFAEIGGPFRDVTGWRVESTIEGTNLTIEFSPTPEERAAEQEAYWREEEAMQREMMGD